MTVAVTVVVEVDVATAPETVAVVVTVFVAARVGALCRVNATMSPGTPVPHVIMPAVIGRMTCIVPLAVAPMEGRTFSGPPMKKSLTSAPVWALSIRRSPDDNAR